MNFTHYYHLLRRHATSSNVILLTAGVLVTMGAWNTVDVLQKNFILQQKVDDMKRQIELVELESDTLKLQQRYLRSDEYLDLSARRYLGKALPGENVIILPPLPRVHTKDNISHDVREITPIEQWKRFFFGG
ncbi:MAG: hypothetical protein WBB39_02085 [Candidatus Saccharimonadales bacterium]